MLNKHIFVFVWLYLVFNCIICNLVYDCGLDDVAEAPPVVTVLPEVITDVREGGAFSVSCTTTGKGDIQVAWYLASKPLSSSPTISIVEIKNGKKLFVKDATLHDSGIYR